MTNACTLQPRKSADILTQRLASIQFSFRSLVTEDKDDWEIVYSMFNL
jgi:hypothetical protein